MSVLVGMRSRGSPNVWDLPEDEIEDSSERVLQIEEGVLKQSVSILTPPTIFPFPQPNNSSQEPQGTLSDEEPNVPEEQEDGEEQEERTVKTSAVNEPDAVDEALEEGELPEAHEKVQMEYAVIMTGSTVHRFPVAVRWIKKRKFVQEANDADEDDGWRLVSILGGHVRPISDRPPHVDYTGPETKVRRVIGFHKSISKDK